MNFPSAQAFRAMGLYPFPLQDAQPNVKDSGKRPRFQDWQALAIHATDRQREAWSVNGWNLGLSLGPSRLVVLDADTEVADEWVSEALPVTPWRTVTSKGHHHFFRLPDGLEAPSNTVRLLACGLDRKASGGFVVAPGSVHWTGVIYEAEGDWSRPMDELPFYDPRWFPPSKPLRPAPMAAPIVLPKGGRADVVRRAQAYLHGVPPAVEGQGGDAHTYRVCCVLMRDFALDKGDALAVLQDWNLTCSPPWCASDLEEKLDHALRYGTGSPGSKLQASSRLLWRHA